MKKAIILFFVCFAFTGFSQRKLKIELEFKYKPPICKADTSGPEIPLPNFKFYVYSAENKCIDTIKTDDNGTVAVRLEPGLYFLFESWKHFKTTPDGSSVKDFYEDCMQTQWAKPNYKLNVDKPAYTANVEEVNIEMIYYDISVSRCPNQYACLKVRHLPSQIKRN